MIKSIGLLVLFISFYLISCTSDDDNTFSVGFDAPVVHGILSTDIVGLFQGYIGNPNIRIYDSRLKPGKDQLIGANLSLYPNPALNSVSIRMLGDFGIKREIYILAARNTLSHTHKHLAFLNAVFYYNDGKPVFSYTTDEEVIEVDVSNFHEGFYRVYVKIGNILLYDNLLVIRRELG